MKLRALLTVSAIYMGILGLGFMLAPRQIGVDAVPTDPQPALIGVFGGGARAIAKLFLVVHLLLAVAFALAVRDLHTPTRNGLE